MRRFDLLEADAQYSLRSVPIANLANKAVLVTGASGIIGTHLLYCLRQIQDAGYDLGVTGIVRDIPEHLEHYECRGKRKLLRGDLTDIAFSNSLPKADIIIHAATYGQPERFLSDAVGTIKLNTACTLTLLDKVNTGGKFLFISTSEIYNGLANPPFNENQIGTTNTTNPRACYIESKRCGEAICNVYRSNGVDAKSARLCLAYGPGTRVGDKRVLNSFIERALRDKVIKLRDLGQAKRSLCYISDAVSMLWLILLKGQYPIYNVGGASKTTVLDLALLIGDYLKVDVDLPAVCDGLVGAPSDVSLDLSRVINEFGVRDFIDLEQGIARTIEWQRALYENNSV